VAPVRSALGFRTIFNLLGPLTNPAGAAFQLIGTTNVATAEKLARAVLHLGTQRTLVVCGHNQLDEVSLWGETTVFDVRGGTLTETRWTAATFQLSECTVAPLQIGSPEESAAIIRDLLHGTPGPARDIVVANAAAALWCAGRVDSPAAGARLAERQIDSQAAAAVLARLVEWTNR
jgi:anthranilate phosphoribosyltransferase